MLVIRSSPLTMTCPCQIQANHTKINMHVKGTDRFKGKCRKIRVTPYVQKNGTYNLVNFFPFVLVMTFTTYIKKNLKKSTLTLNESKLRQSRSTQSTN